ncbi:hypothetical protein [Burkholderia cepacia]|uniref:hypothetical protein n=1 Tax=Burkholderia cepacia TaxID=292 RepID=UPI0015886212|nr:hypothetical protein [Burkholderia cepacia]
MTTINEIHDQLMTAQISHIHDDLKDKISFNDDKYERTIIISKKTSEPDLFVYISKKRKKTWDQKQTEEQNKECGKERNRFIKEVFNKFPIEFKLPEWKPTAVAHTFEGSNPTATTTPTTTSSTPLKTDDLGFPDFNEQQISDEAIIRSLGEDNK